MALKDQILRMIREARRNGRVHPSSKRFYARLSERGVTDSNVDKALSELLRDGKIRVASGLWHEVGALDDNRKPRGPKKLDPNSAEARTLALPLYAPKAGE